MKVKLLLITVFLLLAWCTPAMAAGTVPVAAGRAGAYSQPYITVIEPGGGSSLSIWDDFTATVLQKGVADLLVFGPASVTEFRDTNNAARITGTGAEGSSPEYPSLQAYIRLQPAENYTLRDCFVSPDPTGLTLHIEACGPHGAGCVRTDIVCQPTDTIDRVLERINEALNPAYSLSLGTGTHETHFGPLVVKKNALSWNINTQLFGGTSLLSGAYPTPELWYKDKFDVTWYRGPKAWGAYWYQVKPTSTTNYKFRYLGNSWYKPSQSPVTTIEVTN